MPELTTLEQEMKLQEATVLEDNGPSMQKITQFEEEIEELRYVLNRKTGSGSADMDGRNIRSLNNNAIHPKTKIYDAIVDPSGNADFTTIEAAVTYTESIGGGNIFIWGGTYTPAAAITITKPTRIEGQSSALVTVNFNSTARNFAISSTKIYTAGTISTITGGVNVTGSGTLWVANASAGQYMFLATKWYLIAAVLTNTTLTLAEAYSDDISLSAYRIATLTLGVEFFGMTIKNSTGTAITATDARQFILNDVILLSNNVGISLTNVSLINLTVGGVASSTSDGVQFTNCGLGGCTSFFSNGNTGNGFTFNTIKTMEFFFCSANSNVEAMKFTTADLVFVTLEARSNSSKGIECISNCNQIIFDGCFIKGSTSDGIKLTASSNYCKITNSHFDTNGGWGINIANANCNKNVVVGNSYNTNTSGTLTDSGTGTVNTGNTA